MVSILREFKILLLLALERLFHKQIWLFSAWN